MARTLDKEFGAAELAIDDPLVTEAATIGWTRYDEKPGELEFCMPIEDIGGDYDFVGFLLTNRWDQTRQLCCVYDPGKWKIGFPIVCEDDSWLDPQAKMREAKFYGKES